MSRDYESSQRLKGFKFTCVTGNQWCILFWRISTSILCFKQPLLVSFVQKCIFSSGYYLQGTNYDNKEWGNSA
jgi:hypothetical protein